MLRGLERLYKGSIKLGQALGVRVYGFRSLRVKFQGVKLEDGTRLRVSRDSSFRI